MVRRSYLISGVARESAALAGLDFSKIGRTLAGNSQGKSLLLPHKSPYRKQGTKVHLSASVSRSRRAVKGHFTNSKHINTTAVKDYSEHELRKTILSDGESNPGLPRFAVLFLKKER